MLLCLCVRLPLLPLLIGWVCRYSGVTINYLGGGMDQAVAQYVRQGWAVESRTDTQAVLTRKPRIGWFWNILLTLLTGGLWLIVVVFKLINRKVERRVLTVDQSGNLIKV